jgi:trehalose/maltose transport system substrate-binding protein
MKKKLFAGLLSAFVAFTALADNTAKKITLNFATGGNKPEMAVTDKIVADYEKLHPNIEIKVQQVPDKNTEAYGFILQLMEAKSSKVDIIRTDIVWIGDLADHLVDLNKYGADKVSKEFFPQIIENNTVNGKLAALPMYVDVGMLYYRPDLLKKYNLTVPETWMELTKAAYLIQSGERKNGNQDFEGYMWDAPCNEGLTCTGLELINSFNGGTIVSKDKKVTVDNANAVKAIAMAAKWIGTISPAGVNSMKGEEIRAVFQSGNAAFMRNFPYAYVLSQQPGSAVKGKVGIAPLPHGEGGKSSGVLGGYQVSVNKYSKHPKEAAEFLIYFTSAKAQKMRAVEAGNAPAIPDLYKDKDVLKKSPEYSDIYNALLTAVPRPSTQCAPNYTQVSITFYKEVYDVLTGKKDAASALSDAAKKISKITGDEISK